MNTKPQKQLPAIIKHPRGSISTYRALKQIKELLELIPRTTEYEEVKIQASLDDIETMLETIQ